MMLNSIELFSGAGGLAIGLEQSGFSHRALVERDNNACDTIRSNMKTRTNGHYKWKLYQQDARTLSYNSLAKNITLVAGGPPCQPFSLGGKHKGYNDQRDLFPEAVRAIREIRPASFVFENVKGLIRASFATYFNYILLQLSYPNIVRTENESWEEHLTRLERQHTSSHLVDLEYKVIFRVLNASDYGVPQNRYRVFIVGFRSDLNLEWSSPSATHTYEGLLWRKWITKEYWEDHKIPKSIRPGISEREKGIVDKLKVNFSFTGYPLQSWKTIRDALKGLPDPRAIKAKQFHNHLYRSGAQKYPGHTGSKIDEPAKTLKAGTHGVPGGENMLVMPSGEVRYFTTRESARIQTFPDDYFFCGSWTESMRQIGNAVPVLLARVVGESVKNQLQSRKK